MNLFAIVLVYLTLGQPAHVTVPAETIAVDSQAVCEQVVHEMLAQHAFDRPGATLVVAGCQRVTPVYRTDGTKL